MPRQDHRNRVGEGEGEGERVRELCDMVSVVSDETNTV